MGTPRLIAREQIEENAPALRQGWRAGIHAWGNLALAYEDYARGALERAQSRLARVGLAPGQDEVGRVLAASRLDDLYLALCCEAGIDAGWSALTHALMPRLKAFARSRGDLEAEADDLVSEFPGYLALPPSQGGAKTRLGTFEGASSLFGWLAVVLNRRRIDRKRSRHATAIVAARGGMESVESTDAATRAPAPGPGPAAAAVEVERSATLRAAIASAFRKMSTRETLAMRLKYADGLQQREIAKLFLVGEARVSVLLKNASEKLRAALIPALGDEWLARGPADADVWTSLRDALGNQMTSSGKPPDIRDGPDDS